MGGWRVLRDEHVVQFRVQRQAREDLRPAVRRLHSTLPPTLTWTATTKGRTTLKRHEITPFGVWGFVHTELQNRKLSPLIHFPRRTFITFTFPFPPYKAGLLCTFSLFFRKPASPGSLLSPLSPSALRLLCSALLCCFVGVGVCVLAFRPRLRPHRRLH